MVKLGYNLDSGSINFEDALVSMKASGADGHLIMIDNKDFFLHAGDLDTIRKYLAALPNTTIIVRLFHEHQGNWSLYPSAATYKLHWTWVKNQLGETLMKRVVLDSPFNEPNLSGDNVAEAQKFVTYCRALVKAAYDAGVKLAIGAFSVGTPHENLLNTVYADLWRDIDRYKQGISWHLYGAGIPELGELADMNLVLDPAKARNAMTIGKWPISYDGWLIARAYRVIRIFEALGLGVPEIYVTEAGIDNVFTENQSHIKEAWRQKSWAIDAFNRDPRGVQAWENYLVEAFKQDFTTNVFTRAVAFIFRHLRRNVFYHPAFKVVCIFALNAQWGYAYPGHPANGTHAPAGSNFDMPQFRDFRMIYLPAINNEPMGEITPMPTEPVMEAKRIRSLQESNIRSAANVTASILHVIKTDWLEGKFSRDSVTPTETRKWHKIEVTVDGKLISGYVAKTELLVVEDLPIVIPPPAPNMIEIYYVEFNGATIRMNKVQWLDAIKSHEFMVTYHNLQAEALKTITPILEAETIANAA